MRVVIQRVDSASVEVHNAVVGSIERGLLAYVCVADTDTEKEYRWIANKLCNLRIFNDTQGNMNLSVCNIQGELLLISNFTLLGDARKGNRPSFFSGISTDEAQKKYEDFLKIMTLVASEFHPPIKVATGVFGAHMHVSSIGNGPVNIILDSPK